MAAKEGHCSIMIKLLEHGALVNPPDVSHTALRGASIFGREECVRQLLQRSANPNALSAGNKTPLMGAAMNGHVAVVKLLMAHGANVETVNEFGETAEMLARTKGHADCVAAIADVPPQNKYPMPREESGAGDMGGPRPVR